MTQLSRPEPSATADYQKSLDFLYGRINYERRPATDRQDFRLHRMRLLLEALGRPDRTMRLIHIAGTKGKGSTATTVATLLRQTGASVGLYTSPHLTHLEERFQVNGELCPAREFIDLVEALRAAVAWVESREEGSPTFFELTTAMALEHFRRRGAAWGVIEVGLGGRLDSTNVIEPTVTCITHIGLDHQAILGETRELIAAEKAGIIKPGVPIVSGVLHPGAAEVIRRIARQQGAPLLQSQADFHYQLCESQASDRHTRLDYRGAGARNWQREIAFSLTGGHQAANAALALAIIGQLQHAGLVHLPWSQRRQALAHVNCRGRLQCFPGSPEVLVDVAHNVDSIAALLEAIKAHFSGRPVAFVFACSSDKDVEAMLSQLATTGHPVIATQYLHNPRAVEVGSLAATARQHGVQHVETAANPALALALAKQLVPPNGLVVCCGSFFLAAELLPLLEAGGTSLTSVARL